MINNSHLLSAGRRTDRSVGLQVFRGPPLWTSSNEDWSDVSADVEQSSAAGADNEENPLEAPDAGSTTDDSIWNYY